jgi:hypothetical protein
MTVRKLLVVGITSILFAWALEFSGLSIYFEFRYKFFQFLFTTLALTVLFGGWRGARMGYPASARLGIGFCILLLAMAWGMPLLDTSPRKHFYLLAHETTPGESMDIVQARFRGYRSWSGDGYVTFSTTPPLETNDVAIISYDPSSKRVIRAEFSPD